MSDLTDEELKATREMRKINEIIAGDEKTADEMFEKLGYEKNEDEIFIKFKNKKGNIIRFWKRTKRIIKVYNIEPSFISIEELKAINKKCKELGWYK